MTGSEILAGALSSLIAAGSWIALPKLWRGYLVSRDVRVRGRVHSGSDIAFMFWGGPLVRRGLARSVLPMALAWSGAVIGYWVAILNGGDSGRHAPHVAKVAGIMTVVWFGIWLAAILTIIMFNRPKVMVPPGQRDEPGAVVQWRADRRRRRR